MINNLEISTSPVVTPFIQKKPEADTSSKAQVIGQTFAVHGDSKPLKERAIEPKDLNQLLKDGCEILNRAIEQKRSGVLKGKIKYLIVFTAVIAAALIGGLAGVGLTTGVAILMVVKGFTIVPVLTASIGTAVGFFGAFGVPVCVFGGGYADRLGDRYEQHKAELQALNQWMQEAKEKQRNPSFLNHGFLQKYGNNEAVADVLKRAEKLKKREEQDWLIRFAKAVQHEKMALDLHNTKQQNHVGIAKKLVHAIQEQKKEGSTTRVMLTNVRRTCAHALKRLAAAVQP